MLTSTVCGDCNVHLQRSHRFRRRQSPCTIDITLLCILYLYCVAESVKDFFRKALRTSSNIPFVSLDGDYNS